MFKFNIIITLSSEICLVNHILVLGQKGKETTYIIFTADTDWLYFGNQGV